MWTQIWDWTFPNELLPYTNERNDLLSSNNLYTSKHPTYMTKENLPKTLLLGEKNNDPPKYQQNKNIFKFVKYSIKGTKWLKYKYIIQLLTAPLT